MDSSTQPKGVDVSNHQGRINWPGVPVGSLAFAYIKATEGNGFTDPFFLRNMVGASSVGIIPGAYHFLSHDIPAKAQADHFAQIVRQFTPSGLMLPPAVDVEPDPASSHALRSKNGAYGTSWDAHHMVTLLDDFQTYCKAELGQYAVIYSYNYFWIHFMGNTMNYATAVPLWLAAYPDVKEIPGGWPFVTFHQYSDNDFVQGIGHVDTDTFNGSLDRLQILAGKK